MYLCLALEGQTLSIDSDLEVIGMQANGNELRTPRVSASHGTDNPTTNSSLTPAQSSPSSQSHLVASTPQKDEFKKSIDERNFFDAFAVVVKDLNQLKVTTIVEDELEDADIPMTSTTQMEGKPGKRLVTVIDLVDGDITNIVGSRFVNDPSYSQLREQHLEQVMNGQRIIKRNLEILRAALRELIEIGQSTGVI